MEKEMSKFLQPVKLSNVTETENINMKYTVAGKDDRGKEQDEEDVGEKKTESNSEATTKQDDRKPLEICVENDTITKNQEFDNETE